MQLVPSPDGSLQVVSGITADGIALEPDVALEAKLAKQLEEGGLVVAAAIQRLDELTPIASSLFGPTGTDLPKERFGVGQDGLEIGFGFDHKVMTKVEHHADVIPIAFAGYPHGGSQGVDVEPGVRIEDDAQARLLGLVGNFADKGHGLLVGIGLLVALGTSVSVA